MSTPSGPPGASQGRPVPPHWLRRNEGTRSPHRVLFLDTETRPELAGGAELHSLRWWHARLVRRHVERPRSPTVVDLAGDQLDGLAAEVDGLAIAKHSLWLYTHNLGFDLQATRLPEMLYGRGWRIADMGIAGRSPWLRMYHGRRRLIMADSASWLPAPLKTIGEYIGIPKPSIDDWVNATDEEIAVRCLADVAILSQAMLTVMDWWDSEDMGRWQWTGPGCGWAAFRHKFLTAKILMDPDSDRLSLERRAIYGGRREAYRVGKQPEGNYADLDFEAAYPTIAANTALPRRPIARVPYMTQEAYRQLPSDWGVLSECTVTTGYPVVPCRAGRSVFYPVGTFTTVLAGPDIRGALNAGATVRMGDTIIYQLEPYLADWGNWVTGIISGQAETVPPVCRLLARHWSRTVVGRFAMHAQRVEDWGDAAWPHFHAETGVDWDSGCEVIDLHACGRHLRVYRDAEPENVFPAVTAWIEAECRQLLGAAMESCPPGSVMQCDTDGFMVDLTAGARQAAAASELGASCGETTAAAVGRLPGVPAAVGPVQVRVKGLYTSAAILGPQQVIVGGQRRLAGVPRSFTELGELAYHGWSWPGYTWQLAHSLPGIYTRPHVTIALRGPYGARWILDNGHTMPPVMRIRGGHNVIVKPSPSTLKKAGRALDKRQPATITKHVA